MRSELNIDRVLNKQKAVREKPAELSGQPSIIQM